MALIDYERHGDYLSPCIILNEPPPELVEPITKYGAMRRLYLKTHRPIEYSSLLLSERLFPHLREVQWEAEIQLEAIMSGILSLNPPPDKAVDGLVWAAHMTETRRTAEMIMLGEVVYT